MSEFLSVKSRRSLFRTPRAHFMANLILSNAPIQPILATSKNHNSRTAFTISTYVEPAHPETLNDTLFERFSDNPALRSIPVVKNGMPLGLIHRHQFIDSFNQASRRESHGNNPCIELIRCEPLLVEKCMPIDELSHYLAEVDSRHFADGFIITEQKRYIGVASGQDLLRELNRMQLEAARYANPLTLLPGNVPIDEHIEDLLQANKPFVACYCDLDSFKSFNELYGYAKGDEMIQLTSRILSWACDPKLDFIGHVGGDDFILLWQSKDWKTRCENVLRSFEQAASLLHKEEHLSAGGYAIEGRDGREHFQRLTSLSIGAIQIAPGQFFSHHEVFAGMNEAKEMAKKIAGNSLFFEQRKSASYPKGKSK